MQPGERKAVFAFGALGGVLPTLAALASTYVTIPTTPLPALGLYFGLLLWAIVGGGVALTNTTAEIRQAIFAGIAAPAIIVNLISGATDAAMKKKTAELFPRIAMIVSFVGASAFQTAVAEEQKMVPLSPSTAGSAANPANAESKTISGTQYLPVQLPPVQNITPQYAPNWKEGGNTKTVVITPRVIGGDPSNPVPVTAKVKVGDAYRIMIVGTLNSYSAANVFSIPSTTTDVTVLGSTIPVAQQVTPIYAQITTKPSFVGDFLWVLGAPRNFQIERAQVTPNEK